MMDNDHEGRFDELLSALRAGDEAAASNLVRRYESQIRRLIRVRLTNTAMRRQLDSIDITQSVFGDFFHKWSSGHIELQSPAQLCALLETMARNKLINKHAMITAAKRDGRRNQSLDDPGNQGIDIPSDEETPSQILSKEEIASLAQKLLTDQERMLVNARHAGKSWSEVAEELGTSPDAARIRYQRAISRIAQQFESSTDTSTGDSSP